MPITNTVFVRVTALLLVAGMIVLVAIVGSTIWLVERTQVHFNEVIEARNARTAVVDLRNALQTAETSERGYILSEEEAYLAPYFAARDAVLPIYRNLLEILPTFPQDQEVIVALGPEIERKLSEMDEVIELVRAGNREAAIAVVSANAHNDFMDRTRIVFSGFIQNADDRLEASAIEQGNAANSLRIVAILGGLVIIGVVAASVFTALRYTRDLQLAQAQLASSNVQLEERVASRTADLLRANEEVQRFAYIVTHDLRAPLVNIMGFTSELEASLEPIQKFMAETPASESATGTEAHRAATEDLPEAIGFIRSSTRKMDGLINAILKISRDGRRPIRPEPVDLGRLLEAAAGAIQHQVAERDGDVEIDPSLPAITSDRLALEQVFGNLLDNAVKYAHPGRKLSIRITGHQAPGDKYQIDVTDNGRGITEGDLERVFELFRRSGEQSQPGEGIGLAHVRTLVRNLGGDITVSSELGQGSTFRVTLARDVRSFIGSHA